jgi:S1-C subfamily serine protease
VIISVDGEQLSQEQALWELISAYRPGDVIVLTVLRGEETFDVEVTLAEYEE